MHFKKFSNYALLLVQGTHFKNHCSYLLSLRGHLNSVTRILLHLFQISLFARIFLGVPKKAENWDTVLVKQVVQLGLCVLRNKYLHGRKNSF